ncbi:amidophosphoribosyltransferase [Paracrocinitomix mangrovi]|uniref:amidophosphoribosyltransferase n=1 Tax=Paracrocinitomix mangrovi TaxID=2862509 RepID=UPI001C8D1098|nr:amidophosphoribosyltransferase [Paracrocinitomix mangrovi]UKN03401.1 amidophosphoribosyltransferase [Paracrocinitomix mangrovi]
MSDPIKHECGIALLRLKKPLQFYLEKYGTAFYGLNKMYLLMEKQHNRGQDGAGLANIKFDVEPGQRYISRYRSIDQQPIQDIFKHVNKRFNEIEDEDPKLLKDINYLKLNAGFTGELFLGHLRYGTFGRNSIESCHPFLRQNNWKTRNLIVAGNFNLTNNDELFEVLLKLGQHPKEKADTVTVLEKIGHFLDEENSELYNQYKPEGYSNRDVYNLIAQNLDIQKILKRSSEVWDGGYAICGLLGHGDAFVLRDPNGIRPTFYYEDDEIVVVTSERPAIQTAFNVAIEDVKELTPGHAIIIKKDGDVSIKEVNPTREIKQCSFERIYFARPGDKDIYAERKNLGRNLVQDTLKQIDGSIDDAVFTYIPNSAEVSFFGLMKGLEKHHNQLKFEEIKAKGSNISDEELQAILAKRARVEKIAIKDTKLRTFISQDDGRDDLVAHVYDITYGTVRKGEDNLVVIDDSIVRGTTLKKSILRILDRLGPKRIVVVSSAPQIRYPDCYGIDMARMGDFIAFEAAITLLKENGKEHIIDEVYQKCKQNESIKKEEAVNHVKEIYAPFTADEISAKIAKLLTPEGINAEVRIVYQSIENLHKAIPNHTGDWYFTGNYPTAGGNKVVNKAFINYVEGIAERPY